MLNGKSTYEKPIHFIRNKHVKKSKMHVEGNIVQFGKQGVDFQCPTHATGFAC